MVALLLQILLALSLADSTHTLRKSDHISLPQTSFSDTTLIDTARKDSPQLMLIPILFSSPDTRLAVGVLPQVVFRTTPSSNPSSIRLDTYYTQNKQYHLLVRPIFWLRDNTFNISGKLSLKKWPTSFYGIGNNSSPQKENFSERIYESAVEVSKKIGPYYYAGASYLLRYGKVNPDDPEGQLANANVVGTGNTLVSSIGTVFKQDTRDNLFYPTRGNYHTLEITGATKLLGSDYNFIRFTLDLRKYIPIHRSHVLALQGVASVSTGDIPFRMLSSVGSKLRGYSSSRYIDQNLAAFQLEYRVTPLFWRIGFVAFTGIADVFGRPGDLHLKRVKYAAGIGLRFLFSRSEKINIRWDYGLGRDSSGDYIDLNEAF